MNRIARRASRVTIATTALLLVGATQTLPPPPMPGLNVQLKFICLLLADDRLGATEISALRDLPDIPPQASLAITTSWRSGTRTATSDIRDALGNNLHVEESIGSRGACNGLQRDIFRLERVGNDYEARFCITGPRPNTLPDVKVTMRLTGSPGTVDMLGDRIFAVASCLPPSGMTMLEGGVSVGRELMRTMEH
jgi:hypothetical protein